MRKLLLFLLISVGINAQFNYQAIVKDSDGNPVTNNQVKFKFSLMYQSSTATPVFIEEHEITTPPDGVVNLSVGGGTVVNGTFLNIDWSQSVFMKEELDTGSGYQDMGTRLIASVPVAEFANKLDGFKVDNSNNILAGKSSMGQVSDTGTNNTAIGWRTLENNGGGSSNVAIGERSMMGGNQEIVYTSGSWNTAVGAATMIMNESGNENSAFGAGAMENSQSGSGNVAVGYQSLTDNNGGTLNVAVGSRAMFAGNTTGHSNTAVGAESLRNNKEGVENVAIGKGALYSNDDSNSTTAVGFLAGNSSSSTLNTFIGYKTNGSDELTNASAFGANAIVTASNTIQLGSVSVTLVNTSGKVSANDYLINGGESLIDIVSQLPSSDDYAALTAEVAEIDIQTDSLSSTQSDITALSTQVDALLAAVDDLDIQTNSLSSTLSESNTSEIKSAQVVINSNDVVLFELGVLRFSWNNTYNTIQVKQSSSSEIVDNWYISGIIRSDTETYIQKSNMTYGLGDDGGYNDRFTPIWSNGFTSLMDGSIALGSAYSNFEFYITPMGSGSTPYDPVPTWQLRGHVDGYNQLTVTCIHAKFDGTSGW